MEKYGQQPKPAPRENLQKAQKMPYKGGTTERKMKRMPDPKRMALIQQYLKKGSK